MEKRIVISYIVIILCSLLLVIPSAAVSVALTTSVSPVSIVQGEKIFINGTAANQPSSVAVWMLGNNFVIRAEETVNADSTFSYEIVQGVTTTLPRGQYFVVVQHPMQNGVYDIDAPGLGSVSGDVFVYDYVAPGAPISVFKIQGPGSLQGSYAAKALLAGINQSYIDDIGVQTQFQIERSINPSNVGVFRPANGNWYLDTTKTGVVNKSFRFGKTGDVPVVGDWDGNGISDIGIFRMANGNWYLDTTKTGVVDKSFHFGTTGDVPVVGDWDGNGISDIGVFRPASGNWYLDTTKTGIVNKSFHFGTTGDTPVVGVWV